MTDGDRIIAFAETYLHWPDGPKVGEPIELDAWQKGELKKVFDNPHGTRTYLLSVARRNSKTVLAAIIVLAYLVGPFTKQNSQVVSGAMSREQASLIFKAAAAMIELSPEVAPLAHVKTATKEIHGLAQNTHYKALAAEGSTALGISARLAVLDELGQVQGPTSEFVDAITTSQGSHDDALLVAISTQAPSDDDLFSTWLDNAQTANDPHTVCSVYAADENCDILDEAQWEKANPGIDVFRSRADIRQQAERAKRMPANENSFRNLILNQRVDQVSSFIPAGVWKNNGAAPAPLDPDIPVWGGLDLSQRTDLTALVLAQKINGIWNVHTHAWTPRDTMLDRERNDGAPYSAWVRQGYLRATPGSTVDLDHIAAHLVEITAGLTIAAIFADRWRLEQLQNELARQDIDLPLEPMGQGYKSMSPALDNLEAELLNGRIAHGGNPVLTMAMMSAKVQADPAGNRKLLKGRYNKRIDSAIALAMCFGPTDINAQTNKAPQGDLDAYLAAPIVV